ncbi:MAG: DEAD/DEAH box helicase [Synergistaceae bacterium]|nr:DEAD/DEAH box helicase [Synergistaceae bacterium]
MLILHCCYGEDFFLWGECSFAGANFRGRRRHVEGAAPGHPWAAGAERIREVLSSGGCEYHASSGAVKIELKLPTVGGKYPIPSTPLLGEIPKQYAHFADKASPQSWTVEALPVGAVDLADMREFFTPREPVSSDGRFLANGLVAAADLCYVTECCSFVISMLERGRFLPDIRASEDAGRYESVWTPMLAGDDAARYGRLCRVMPDILRTFRGEDASAETVLRDIVSDFVDGLIRDAWTQKGNGDTDASSRKVMRAIMKNAVCQAECTRERKRRGKLVNALNPHALWMRSLGWTGETDGLSQSLASIYREVKEWRGCYEWLAHVPFKLAAALSGGDKNPDRWHLEYSFICQTSGRTIPARDVWNAPRGIPKADYMRRYTLLTLGRIGEVFPPVERSLELPAPEGCPLTLSETADFLKNHAPELTEMGVKVIYPDWWSENSSEMLTIRGARGENSSFRWCLAWRGTVLSDEEKRAITDGDCPLIRLRGEWVYISSERVSALMLRLGRMPGDISSVDAIRLAIKDPFIDGFSDMPELESIYGALRNSVPPEILHPSENMRGELRPYQEIGYSWLAFLSGLGVGACLADDMGLGKTIQALALIQRYRDIGYPRPVLLVCPTSVIETWRVEAEKFFPSLSLYVHHGHDRRRGESFARAAESSALVLSSYALLYRDAELYKNVGWHGIILDEAQNIKNPDTRQARAARSLSADWRIALTGTPIENHVGDLWSIMEFLMPGMLGSRRHFVNSYVKPISAAQDAGAMEKLRKAVRPFIMRRLKADPAIAPDLPSKIETMEYCGLKREQMKLYAAVADEFTRGLESASGIKRKGLVLAGLTKMKQICDHPSLFAKDGDLGPERSSKLERLMSLAEEMYETGDRTLIFTQYVEMGRILKYQLQEHFGREAFFLHGGVPKADRDKMVRAFQESECPRFFVLSLRAGGVGLNLTRANHVVMYDRWWNPAVETQAIDRAYRIGQTSNVQVHIFCCKGTLEERIGDMITSKKTLANSVILERDDWITELSDRELRKLVALSPRMVHS